ncbi:hypothetical protein BLOT_011708 [Blomia tropicalis]|nr:hypothetical protein BLOT_011708 [Blomia tropicalis]
MFNTLRRYLQSAWSSPPITSTSRAYHQPDPTIESLLEPIRYSMAFLTLFSIMSTIIVAILLVPFGALQLLAQFVSLIVSLSGLIGTFKRSIILSSIYALSMLLFLFLQCSYFFVLLKLVQEVKLTNAINGDKLLYNGNGNEIGIYHYSGSIHSPSSVSSYNDNVNIDHHISIPRHHTMTMGNVHVRHISAMLNEELAYLSLLTVPMLAWLPPSLFMESVAVLLLSMQALAGACFLYALRRSESFYDRTECRHTKLLFDQSLLDQT